MPLIHPDCLSEVHTLVGAARDALADAGLPHDARACWECLQAWDVPAISHAQVRSGLDRLPPYAGGQQTLLDTRPAA